VNLWPNGKGAGNLDCKESMTHKGWVPPMVVGSRPDFTDETLVAAVEEQLERTMGIIDGLIEGKQKRK